MDSFKLPGPNCMGLRRLSVLFRFIIRHSERIQQSLERILHFPNF